MRGRILRTSGKPGLYNVSRFSWNRANDNEPWGYFADYGTPGMGNQASGNSSGDCLNVRCT